MLGSLRKWFALPQRASRRSPARPRFQLTLEALEERCVPTITIPVRNTNDSGAGSLRQAVHDGNLANDAVAITFLPNVTGVITLESSLENLEESFTIMGPGSGSLTVQRDLARANFRIFNVDDATLTCSITGLTLANGNATGLGAGGAIRNMGNLTLNDCLFHDNTAPYGGAIYNQGNLPASACWFWENTATTSSGGAIYNMGGTLTLASGCQLFANEAAQYGGAIFNSYSGTVNIRDNAQIDNNYALWGGGIYNQGNLQMNGGYLGHNHATVSDVPLSGRGGAYYGESGTASFQGVNFDTNSADNRGGGFYLQAGTLGFNTCTISGNTSPTGPGGYIERGATYNDPVNCTINDIIVREM